MHYSYSDGTEALRNANIRVGEGERLVVLGPNGAGKSTLLYLMAALFLPDRGELEIMGERVKGDNDRRARENIGLLFQDPDDQIFMPTVRDDVAFGPTNMGLDREETEERVEEAMEQVGILGLEERVPHHLSYGEKKRVAIAGVLAMRPSILLLDEPTANLDPRGKETIMDILDSLDVTIVMATHDLGEAFKLVDRAVVLDTRVLFDGSIRELATERSVLGEAHLELPPLTRTMLQWKEERDLDFEPPLTREEALSVLREECGDRADDPPS